MCSRGCAAPTQPLLDLQLALTLSLTLTLTLTLTCSLPHSRQRPQPTQSIRRETLSSRERISPG
jgi:hypothetical protein